MQEIRRNTLEIAQPLLSRLSRCPREPDLFACAARSVTAAVCRAWLSTYHRLAILGRENLPDVGPYVLVSNHASHLDGLCLLAALPMKKLHRAYPVAAADYFFCSAARVALSAVCVNAVPFDRRSQVRGSMAMCRQILGGGDNVLILFPEGTRTISGEIGEFRRGIGDLVAGKYFPVVPCHIEGSFAALPRGGRFPKPFKLTLRIGKPISFADRTASKCDAVQIANELREAVVALGGRNHKLPLSEVQS